MRLSCVCDDLVSCAQEALSFPSCEIFPLMAVKCVGVQKENILALSTKEITSIELFVMMYNNNNNNNVIENPDWFLNCYKGF